ncbi:MAG: hypothetical protein M3R14_14485 [Acidobacteriota bacterium]|nr:hypothetical protein [Acidobacteriota bacterium]
MSQRNKNNSIVFLTTLSVYLGLVLVGGATPSVLAQAILEKGVETDYLTDEKILAEYVSAFQKLFVISKELSVEHSEELKAVYGKEIKDGEYELNCFHNINRDFSQTFKGVSGFRTTYEPKFQPLFEKLNKIFPHTIEEDKPQIKINLALSDKDFSLKVTAYQDSDKRAEQIFNSFTNELSRIRIQQADQSRIIYQNTEISRENNQILIDTRLPRGSLDELLKQNAKAEKE